MIMRDETTPTAGLIGTLEGHLRDIFAVHAMPTLDYSLGVHATQFR
jgi:hypothetical protein